MLRLSFSRGDFFPLPQCERHHRPRCLVQAAIWIWCFGTPKCPHVAHSEKTTLCTQDSLNLCKKTFHQMQEGSICTLCTQPEILFHKCHSSTWLPSKNKGLQYYYVVTSKASSLSDSHFSCEKCDEKWRPSLCVLLALQLKSVRMLWFSPCWTLTQKIQLYQQLSSLVSPYQVHPILPFLLMTHKWNKCFLV